MAAALRPRMRRPAAGRLTVNRSSTTSSEITQALRSSTVWPPASTAMSRSERAARANLWMQSKAKFFCSELVAEAYRRAGAPLFPKPAERASPEDVAKLGIHGKLLYVGHLRS